MDPSDLLEHYENNKKRDAIDDFVENNDMSQLFEKLEEKAAKGKGKNKNKKSKKGNPLDFNKTITSILGDNKKPKTQVIN